MIPGKITVCGTGCALADYLYAKVSFSSPAFKKYLSIHNGDGGLSPGKLVFTEELEKYSATPYPDILREITQNKEPDKINVGGPGLVSLIHVAQLLANADFDVRFYGAAGPDETMRKIFRILRKIPLDIDNYLVIGDKLTPFTDVFSDPDYDLGRGERTFVNNIGAAWDYSPGFLNEDFYDARIVCFGGTALVPEIHDNLTSLLKKAKSRGSITIVNTVFDFRNEKANPGKPWPLGEPEESFGLIDVLIMDQEEALKISGTDTSDKAVKFYRDNKVSSFIITNGANDIIAFSDGRLFCKSDILKVPVSAKVKMELQENRVIPGDTTGCGDNFAGGVIASIAMQLRDHSSGQLDFMEAISWGVASGGFTCFYLGGCYIEKYPGEKLQRIKEYQKAYLEQTVTR